MTWLGRRKEQRRVAEAEFYSRHHYLREDITVFGEQLGELHVDTLTDTLDDDARAYYSQALGSYERAKSTLESAVEVDDLDPVVVALVDGRHQRACVLARVAGEPLPAKLAECFFNPQHGPSHTQIAWTPPGGVERTVPVCRSDANRMTRGEAPVMRMVRVGDRWVPMVTARSDDKSYFASAVDLHALRDAKSRDHGRGTLYGAGGRHDGGGGMFDGGGGLDGGGFDGGGGGGT